MYEIHQQTPELSFPPTLWSGPGLPLPLVQYVLDGQCHELGHFRASKVAGAAAGEAEARSVFDLQR